MFRRFYETIEKYDKLEALLKRLNIRITLSILN